MLEVHVRVATAPLVTVVGAAVKVTVGGSATVTVCVDDPLVPPGPVQVNEKLVVAVKPLVTCVPLAPKLPLQPPEAAQDVAFVELQVRVVVAPDATVVGLAVNSAVGAGGVVACTVTVATAAGLVPPAPLQVSEKCVVAATGPVLCVPAVASAPLQPPEAAQVVASVELQVSVAALPATTLVGDAASDAVGTATGGGGVGV